MNYQIKIEDQTTSAQFQDPTIDETDLESVNSSPDLDEFIKNVSKHKFVIGIAKPEEMRIGLSAINRSKVTIKGVLGITQGQR